MLNHKQHENKSILDVANELDILAKDLDQKHRMQKKIQFFLDIRGYFIIKEHSIIQISDFDYRANFPSSLILKDYILSQGNIMLYDMHCDVVNTHPSTLPFLNICKSQISDTISGL